MSSVLITGDTETNEVWMHSSASSTVFIILKASAWVCETFGECVTQLFSWSSWAGEHRRGGRFFTKRIHMARVTSVWGDEKGPLEKPHSVPSEKECYVTDTTERKKCFCQKKRHLALMSNCHGHLFIITLSSWTIESLDFDMKCCPSRGQYCERPRKLFSQITGWEWRFLWRVCELIILGEKVMTEYEFNLLNLVITLPPIIPDVIKRYYKDGTLTSPAFWVVEAGHHWYIHTLGLITQEANRMDPAITSDKSPLSEECRFWSPFGRN